MREPYLVRTTCGEVYIYLYIMLSCLLSPSTCRLRSQKNQRRVCVRHVTQRHFVASRTKASINILHIYTFDVIGIPTTTYVRTTASISDEFNTFVIPYMAFMASKIYLYPIEVIPSMPSSPSRCNKTAGFVQDGHRCLYVLRNTPLVDE